MFPGGYLSKEQCSFWTLFERPQHSFCCTAVAGPTGLGTGGEWYALPAVIKLKRRHWRSELMDPQAAHFGSRFRHSTAPVAGY